MQPSTKLLLSVAISTLISGAAQAATGAVTKAADAATKPAAKVMTGQCNGGNSCKGKSDCHGAANACAGQNSCKGKGWKTMSETACKDAKGTFKAGM